MKDNIELIRHVRFSAGIKPGGGYSAVIICNAPFSLLKCWLVGINCILVRNNTFLGPILASLVVFSNNENRVISLHPLLLGGCEYCISGG